MYWRSTVQVTSSIAGKIGAPISSTYSATKHALQGYFHALRSEVAHRGVQVTLACPGPVYTEITQHAFTAEYGKSLGQSPDDGSNRMSPHRCAELMITAMHHGLPEVWAAPQPTLLFTYLAQYCPSFAAYMAANIVGPRRVDAFSKGDTGYGSVQSVGALLRTLCCR